jgi:lysozyme
MNCNQAGIDLIKHWEGCKLTAYQDTRGIWTIGWGHTGDEVVEGVVWTQAMADSQFQIDLALKAEKPVNAALQQAVDANQFAALCSLCYNIGAGAFRASHLLYAINDNDFSAVPAEFMKWCHNHDGSINNGLLNRRSAEVILWNAA